MNFVKSHVTATLVAETWQCKNKDKWIMMINDEWMLTVRYPQGPLSPAGCPPPEPWFIPVDSDWFSTGDSGPKSNEWMTDFTNYWSNTEHSNNFLITLMHNWVCFLDWSEYFWLLKCLRPKIWSVLLWWIRLWWETMLSNINYTLYVTNKLLYVKIVSSQCLFLL